MTKTSLEILGLNVSNEGSNFEGYRDPFDLLQAMNRRKKSWNQLPALAIRASGRGEKAWTNLSSYYHGFSPTGVDHSDASTLGGIYVDCATTRFHEVAVMPEKGDVGYFHYLSHELDPFDSYNVYEVMRDEDKLGLLRPDKIKKLLVATAKKDVPESLDYNEEEVIAWQNEMFERTGIGEIYERPDKSLPVYVAEFAMHDILFHTE